MYRLWSPFHDGQSHIRWCLNRVPPPKSCQLSTRRRASKTWAARWVVGVDGCWVADPLGIKLFAMTLIGQLQLKYGGVFMGKWSWIFHHVWLLGDDNFVDDGCLWIIRVHSCKSRIGHIEMWGNMSKSKWDMFSIIPRVTWKIMWIIPRITRFYTSHETSYLARNCSRWLYCLPNISTTCQRRLDPHVSRFKLDWTPPTGRSIGSPIFLGRNNSEASSSSTLLFKIELEWSLHNFNSSIDLIALGKCGWFNDIQCTYQRWQTSRKSESNHIKPVV